MSEPIPKITLMNKGVAQFEAYVNSYVVSEKPYRMADGSLRYELYYLSMFGPRGCASSVNAIFSGLVSQPAVRDISIDGLGGVALMHRSVRISSSGYAPSWSCDFTEFGPDRALHAVVESKTLTLWDPHQASLTRRRASGGQKGKHRDAKKQADRGKREGGSIASLGGEVSEDTAQKLERRPIFLLLVPGGINRNEFLEDKDPQAEQEALTWVQRLHLAYLDKRCPWPLIDEWADFLWRRAHSEKRREIERLRVWSYTPPNIVLPPLESAGGVVQDDEEALAFSAEADDPGDEVVVAKEVAKQERVLPVFTDAYLCFPHLEKMMLDLTAYIATGVEPFEQEAIPQSAQDNAA